VRPPSRSPASPPVTQEQIAIRAYELFLEEGSAHGRDVDHWLRAEQQMLSTVAPRRPPRIARARSSN